ncbi:hypothetical protein JXA12_05960 [Candidatus Woesearchaeota archaeon]|nr:hypothetical protein [Candidatus Woesearchaeota archaeon]
MQSFVEDASHGRLTTVPVDEHGRRFHYEPRGPLYERVHSFYDVLYNRPDWQGQELVGKLNLPLKVQDSSSINRCLEALLQSYPDVRVMSLREYGSPGALIATFELSRLNGYALIGYFQGRPVPMMRPPTEQSPFMP